MTQLATLNTRYLPSGEFTRAIEELIDKEDPDNTVGWSGTLVPAWAVGFRPRVIADLGTGLGGETIAVLKRMAQWGCLSQLQSIHLFEHDGTLHSGGKEGVKRYLTKRIQTALRQILNPDVDVQVHAESLAITEAEGGPYLQPLHALGVRPDFVLASHITYFFDDGSGERFARSIIENELAAGGLLWLNIRNLHCPAYDGRAAVLAKLGIQDPQPYDYAEYFEANVLPQLVMAQLLDKATVATRLRPNADRRKAVELVMWRSTLDMHSPHADALRSAINACAEGAASVLSETQFVIERNAPR